RKPNVAPRSTPTCPLRNLLRFGPPARAPTLFPLDWLVIPSRPTVPKPGTHGKRRILRLQFGQLPGEGGVRRLRCRRSRAKIVSERPITTKTKAVIATKMALGGKCHELDRAGPSTWEEKITPSA